MAQKERRTLLGVHGKEVRGLYDHFLASQGMTDEDVFLPAYAPDDDFCTTAVDQPHLPIRDLLYSRFATRVQEKFPILKINEDSGGYLLSMTALTRVLEVFQVFSSSSLLLVPMGILLFGGLGKLAMFGVVVASVFVISTVVVLGRGVGMGESGGSGHGNGLLLGVVAAYTAVLATFLAQLGT
ncbi:hypothetical protein CONLIGDRAFT_632358 [Coniochaeta ligniaria NRRL 30616]|uniref:Uncharacterized protein n=1 Tax=Coniochaeta ligniaria NRRL 30616 TaxID=1408157 RepID=A0A1J7ISJ2_9PEZI|nr:hypothetical protein CONLIGDRAFT_632358 [Coniochaeta ligniaria NRRL 30616]